VNDLDAALLAAHHDQDNTALIALYSQAADQAENAGDTNAACFFLTHAYVFALEEGSANANALHIRLKEHGREE